MLTICKSFCMVIIVFMVAFVCRTNICLSATEVAGKVNINTATEEQIAVLPGIGPKLASEVVSYRKANSNFREIEDLKKVKGVGDKKFEKIKNFVVVEGDTTIKSEKVAKSEKGQK
ncbi:MAG: helix-hairpin-helix domain-containing protein [Planctomycetia bacterium]|nr:MAG: helix-hairpin-helix domain-containing protein [Planctomycetia bacterium]TVL95641.1 MAG: hypothetical protein CV082_10165 [Candidatus Brocadia sp. BL1]GJQ22595.1 MAG: hypothetical protein HBSAPP01_03850 [Candidatus Brocadia sapporoensis]HQU30694.1 helix-hairpin-helix domain-containing protein [Candidatus Brocadia sapporoensis]